jgi:hypothetical protein
MRVCRLLILNALVCSGCGPGHGDLSGKVSFNGQPVRVGSVVVLPADNMPRSVLIEDGTYTVRNLPAGSVKLAVNSPDPLLQRSAGRNAAARQKAEAAAAVRAEKWFPIPEKYASFEQSGLSCEVRSGTNSFDLALVP